MLFYDQYQTISKISEGVFKDRGSKFLAFAYPINSEIELKEILHNLKIAHPKANHFCLAYRLTPDRFVFRINDDGEPTGTAGRPILNVLLSKDITNVLIVVVRYFGGNLLGVPGLINAYKSAAEDAINQANIIEKTIQDIYEISFEYPQMNDVMKLIKDENLRTFDQDFDLTCKIKIAINQANVNRLMDKLGDILDIKTTFLYTQ